MSALFTLMNNSYQVPIQGNISQIPPTLLRFISTIGECREERRLREEKEDETNKQILPTGSYGVYDTIDHFVNFYYGFPSTRKDQFTQMLTKIFTGILVPWSGNQVINSRGNGLCAYNCLFMFLTMTRPDILDLFDSNDNFPKFKQYVRDMAVESLDTEIKEFMEPLIDDPSTPDLDPILTSFVDFTGISILMVNINDNTFTFTVSKFSHKDFPSDHIVLIRKACHLMFVHGNGNYTGRQQIYQQIDKNTDVNK